MFKRNNAVNADSYVQDGLVFQLDGIEWGNVAGHWIERKNGYDWYEANNVNLHTEDDAMVFAGSSYMLTNDTIPFYPYESCSIEICAETNVSTTDSLPCINLGSGSVSALRRAGYRFICYVPPSGSATAINNTVMLNFTNISFNGNYFLDAALVTSLGSYAPTNGMKKTSPVIGNAYFYNNNASSYWLIGKIHSIRIYNRQLTVQEIAFNFNIDKQRFNV